MNISQQIDQLNSSLLQNFSEIVRTDIELGALVLDLTYLLKKLKTESPDEQSANLIVNDLGKVITHIILKENK